MMNTPADRRRWLIRTMAAAAVAIAASRASGQVPGVASSSLRFVGTPQVVETRLGVVVHDPIGRRVVFLDSALRVVATLVDTTPLGRLRYPGSPATLVADHGSALLVGGDPSATIPISDDGTTSAPRRLAVRSDECHVLGLIKQSNGVTCLARRRPSGGVLDATLRAPNGTSISVPAFADSVSLLEVGDDGAARTIATIHQPIRMSGFRPDSACTWWTVPSIDPLDPHDLWTATDDGWVVVLRAGTQTLEWISPRGAVSTVALAAALYHPLSRSAQIAIVDARRRELALLEDARERPRSRPDQTPGCDRTHVARLAMPGDDFALDPTLFRGFPSAPRPEVRLREESAPGALRDVPAEMIPDRSGAVWFRMSATSPDGLTYYVARRDRPDVEAVRVSAGRIVAFGKNDRVYFVTAAGDSLRLSVAERSTVVRSPR